MTTATTTVPAAKRPVKKTAKKAEAKATKPAKKAPAPKKGGLSKPQVRILTALAKKSPLSRSELAEKAEIDPTAVGNQAGYTDPEINARSVHAGNLVNKKLVKIEQHEGDPVKYSITAAGKEALAKAKKE